MLTLERRLGREFLYGDSTAKVLKKPVDFVLTVPAVWSDKARQMTLEAAVRAGLGVAEAGNASGLLRLITEPEGAAEYALRSMQTGMLKVRRSRGECGGGCQSVEVWFC